jgi:hypothetical protein
VNENRRYKKKFRETRQETKIRDRKVIQKLSEAAFHVYDEAVGRGDGSASPKSTMAGSFNQSKSYLEKSSSTAKGIALVTHGDFLELLLSELLEFSRAGESCETKTEFCFNNASITVADLIVVNTSVGKVVRPRLIRTNDVSHFASTLACITGGPVV